jgi:hypothetical protein
VSEISQVVDYDVEHKQIITNDWFVAGPDRAAIRNPHCPIPIEMLDRLVDHGYDPDLHVGAW